MTPKNGGSSSGRTKATVGSGSVTRRGGNISTSAAVESEGEIGIDDTGEGDDEQELEEAELQMGGMGGRSSNDGALENSELSEDENDELIADELEIGDGDIADGDGEGEEDRPGEELERDGEAESSEEAGDEDEDEEEEEEEDSSDMDVDECDKKRYEYIDDLTDLERQFAILREQLYRERITQIEAKLTEVRSGKASEYLQPLEELQINVKNRMEVGAILRELRLQNIKCKYDAEQIANEQNYKSEKELLWDSIKADLEEKIHILEEDKNNVDFSTGLWEQTSRDLSATKRSKLSNDPMDPDCRKKPVTVTGPYIVYLLKEADIMDDWTLVKKSLAQRRKQDSVRL